MKVNLYDAIYYINQATSLEELQLIFERIITAYGFDMFSVQYTTHEQLKKKMTPHYLTNFEKEWTEHYYQSQYHRIDPVILLGAEKRTPYFWSNLWEEIEMTSQQKDFFNEASEFGVASGIGLPIFLDGPKPGIVTLVSSVCNQQEIKQIMSEEHASLMLLATSFQNAAKKLFEQRPPDDAPNLTPRERECLTWAANGKTDAEIGMILNISHRTVNAHMANAYQKLGCVSREQAVVKALLLRLISL